MIYLTTITRSDGTLMISWITNYHLSEKKFTELKEGMFLFTLTVTTLRQNF